ncbi:hypothetical protein F7725_024585 [Dissostichus mawsoni]|uniref:Uncharacterized protein n=1 Tax=Dissostichus mawsoni TaxID=36200 RepID=A0A7J5X901_DISMA|nr:hypothetical protein F7725_024585 [Dissostichus mawsoni]
MPSRVPLTLHRVPLTLHRVPLTLHRVPLTLHRVPLTLHRVPLTLRCLHRVPLTLHRVPLTLHRVPLTLRCLHRVPLTLHRVPLTLHRVPLTLHRVPLTLHRVPLTLHRVPLTLRCLHRGLGQQSHFFLRHLSHFLQEDLLQSLSHEDDVVCGLNTKHTADETRTCAVMSATPPAQTCLTPPADGRQGAGGLVTYWQTVTWSRFPEPLLANITLSWNKSLELVDDVVVTFEYGRPTTMVLEKSPDRGVSWQPYQFYADDCLEAFGMPPKRVADLAPSNITREEKQVVFEVRSRFGVFAGPKLINMAALWTRMETMQGLREFFSFTNLRLRLLRPALGGTYVQRDNLLKYFYAVSNIDVPASISPSSPTSPNSPTIPGRSTDSETEGNKGEDPAAGGPAGDCECNAHSNRCSYIDFINVVTCVSCRHNTRGQSCQHCRPGFYRNPSLSLQDENSAGATLREPPPPTATPRGCVSVEVEPLGGANGGTCVDLQRCDCPDSFTGTFCEKRVCLKKGGCQDDAEGSAPSLTSQFYLLTLSLFCCAL